MTKKGQMKEVYINNQADTVGIFRCGKTFTGTKKAVEMKVRFHKKLCEFCRNCSIQYEGYHSVKRLTGDETRQLDKRSKDMKNKDTNALMTDYAYKE